MESRLTQKVSLACNAHSAEELLILRSGDTRVHICVRASRYIEKPRKPPTYALELM